MSQEQEKTEKQESAAAVATATETTTEDELNQLKQYIREREERFQAKLAAKTLNQQCAAASRLDDSVLKNLDSSIKKVTSFIKRLKTMTESQRDSLAKDLKQLNLSKYLSEVAAAFLEAKLKMNDIPCALHLCSLVHQSYAEFAPIMFEQWQKILSLKKDEKLANPSKLRVDLRFFAELITISVLPQKESLSLLGNQLTILTAYDKDYSNLSVMTSFCKHCGEDFADLVPLKFERLAAKYEMRIGRNELYSAERQKAVKTLFRDYFKSLSQFVLNEHKEVQKIERQNWKQYQTKGEVSTEKKEKYDQTVSNFKKLLENAEVLGDLLGEQMPELPADELKKRDEDLINIDVFTPSSKSDEFDSSTSLWEDEDTRQFYECMPDLKSLIPGILYKPSSSTTNTGAAGEAAATTTTTEGEAGAAKPVVAEEVAATPVDASAEDLKLEMEKMERELQELESQQQAPTAGGSSSADADLPPPPLPDLDEKETTDTTGATASVSISAANMKILMDAFINQLPNCVNRELIDKATKEFCMQLNTKANRKRLVNALFQVQRTRLDLLAFYARLVATLQPIMPEIATELAQLLLNDFRYHVRKKDQINIESKIKTARFIGELVKFNMFGKMECLNCLKTLLADFRHHNIEMFCNLLDVCGRYLYRSQESHMKLKLLLEILMRKKQAAMSMDSRYTIMIENAFYYCNPPESKQSESKKVRNPMHEYIKKILYKDLNKLCVEKILRHMRKLNWFDDEIKSYSIKCLISAWNVRFNSIHCLANLVSGLALYYEDVGIKIVDGVLEDIQLGMEINLGKFNQRRVSMVKYIGELYNYRMIGSSIIFKTLYTLILFGVIYDVNEAIAQSETSLDPVDNFFRIRLVCILLDTCGQYFDRGSTKKKLDCFLVYFQRYYMLKKETSSNLLAASSGGSGGITSTTSSTTPAVASITNAVQSAMSNPNSANLSNMSKPFDSIDIECVYTECIQALRPAFKFANSYSEACERVARMEDEIKESLMKAVPNFEQLVNSAASGGPADAAAMAAAADSAGLGTIREDEEDETNYAYIKDCGGGGGEGTGGEEDEEYAIGASGGGGDGDGDEDEDTQATSSKGADDYEEKTRADSENQDSEADEQSVANLVARKQHQEMSKEDEEFIKAFDALVTENIAQRTKDAIKMPTVDIQVPMVSKKTKPAVSFSSSSDAAAAPTSNLYRQLTGASDQPPTTSNEQDRAANSNKTLFNFVVMTKKGNKTQYHNMEVPVSSEFAQQFRAREEAEKQEKEKLKQVTLNINQRMEQEELQEMIQSVTGQFYRSSGGASSSSMSGSGGGGGASSGNLPGGQNTNRDRHQKYIHPKGAPDADLIFGPSTGPSNRRQTPGGGYSK